MNTAAPLQAQAVKPPPARPAATGLVLQRNCACGAGAGVGGACGECRKKLTLQPFRRDGGARIALIYLEPAPRPRLPIGRFPAPDVQDAVEGKEIDCTEAHLKLFAELVPPKAEMAQGECTEPGAKTIDPGQSKP